MNLTDRQLRAFMEFRGALEYTLMLKNLPIISEEQRLSQESKIAWAKNNLEEARMELEASIVDEFDLNKPVYLVQPVDMDDVNGRVAAESAINKSKSNE